MRLLPDSNYVMVRYRYGVRNAWMGEERWYELGNRPPITSVAQDLRKMARPPFGYLPYGYDWRTDATLYADWYIWPWAKLLRASHETFWGGLRLLRRFGLIHSVAHPSVQTRLRDIRLGRGEG